MKVLTASSILAISLVSSALLFGCTTTQENPSLASTQTSQPQKSTETVSASNQEEITYKPSSASNHRILAAGSHVSGAILGS